MTENTLTRKIILGLGNTLNRDEGLGVYALEALEAHLKETYGDSLPPEIEFVDGGVLGLNLLPWVEECSHLLVLDAINARKQPGSLIELRRDEISLYTGIKLSDHQITFQEVLGLANFRGYLPPHLHLIGAQPAEITVGVGLSDTIHDVLPQILTRAEIILQAWGLLDAAVVPHA